jgi:hypothetical protein
LELIDRHDTIKPAVLTVDLIVGEEGLIKMICEWKKEKIQAD